eukprot:scaffold1740_cov254-Pinguiococcus_pyrenoidosus.AAC.20
MDIGAYGVLQDGLDGASQRLSAYRHCMACRISRKRRRSYLDLLTFLLTFFLAFLLAFLLLLLLLFVFLVSLSTSFLLGVVPKLFSDTSLQHGRRNEHETLHI